MKLIRMLDKKNHFFHRYREHFKAIGFAQRKKKEIKNQINDFLTLHQSKYSLRDFQFLEDISELVIRARRALTYTYPMRFYMKRNQAKKEMFDFLQGDLESSLEKLVKIQESNWT